MTALELAQQQSPQAPSADAPDSRDRIDVSSVPKVGTIAVIGIALVVIALFGVLFVVGYVPARDRRNEAVAIAAAAGGEPAVRVISPRVAAVSTVLILPADVQPYQHTLLFPRASGYLKRQLVDIGDRVEVDQLLAEIDAPEVDAQLAQSVANAALAKVNVDKAETDLELARTTLARYDDAVKGGAVARQQVDEHRSQFNQMQANVEVSRAALVSAEAEVQRLVVLQGFQRVTAPFAGTITTRNFDIGALLSASSGAKELFQIDNMDTLRVFVAVPQVYATAITIGQPASILVRNYPDREFEGTVARTAGAVDAATRTLRIQVDVPNSERLLTGGMYAQVRFNVAVARPPLLVPTSALIFNADGLSVAVVNDGKAHFQMVSVGRDFGNEVEIVDGLAPEASIISNPGERIREGMSVRILTDAVGGTPK